MAMEIKTEIVEDISARLKNNHHENWRNWMAQRFFRISRTIQIQPGQCKCNHDYIMIKVHIQSEDINIINIGQVAKLGKK